MERLVDMNGHAQGECRVGWSDWLDERGAERAGPGRTRPEPEKVRIVGMRRHEMVGRDKASRAIVELR